MRREGWVFVQLENFEGFNWYFISKSILGVSDGAYPFLFPKEHTVFTSEPTKQWFRSQNKLFNGQRCRPWSPMASNVGYWHCSLLHRPSASWPATPPSASRPVMPFIETAACDAGQQPQQQQSSDGSYQRRKK